MVQNVREFLTKNGPYMAAAISFYSFLSLFPLLIAVIAILSFFLPGFDESSATTALNPPQTVQECLARNTDDATTPITQDCLILALQALVPVLDLAEQQFLTDFFQDLRNGRVATSALAIVGVMFAATAVFGAVRKSVNTIWGIRKTRPFLLERVMDFTLMFGVTILLLLSLSFSLLLGLVQDFAVNLETLFPGVYTAFLPLLNILGRLVAPVLSFLVFVILYWWLPNVRLGFRDVWLTAVGATIAFEIAKQIFVWYVNNLGTLANNLYGGVSSIIVLLIFVYTSAIIMLVGAMLTAHYSRYRETRNLGALNQRMAKNLERVRSTSVLVGMPNVAKVTKLPAGRTSQRN